MLKVPFKRIRRWYIVAGPVSSEIWNKSMKARKPTENGTGDWGLYKGSL